MPAGRQPGRSHFQHNRRVSSIDPVPALADAARAAGGRALVVGGWVRDRLRAEPSKDVDVEVFGISQEALPGLLAPLGRVEPVGQSFPVYKLIAGGLEIDVALPRRESKHGRGHKGFDVRGDPSMPFDEAARRRDFTINAIAWDPLTGEHVDPFDGRADLARGILRAVDPATFGDDSLRVLRAVQFAARFGLTMAEDSKAICRAIALDDLPPLLWHAELGLSLPDVWTGERQRGVQLHLLGEAVKTWKFNPGSKGGRPAPGYALVPIDFHLSE